MRILPAIDIKDGKCVRLAKGDYTKITYYFDNPIEVAGNWISQGSNSLHIVDLDGAKSGSKFNFKVIEDIRKSYPEVFIQVGGGIRDINSINEYLNIGIDKVIVGTKVISDPEFLDTIPEGIKKRLIIDLAIKNGALDIDGWSNSFDYSLANFLKILAKKNTYEIVFTDVSKDGMLEGMNFEQIRNILEMTNISLIASGGVTSIDDIKHLNSIKHLGISGVIIGKALYENKISLSEAIKITSL